MNKSTPLEMVEKERGWGKEWERAKEKEKVGRQWGTEKGSGKGLEWERE